MNNRLRKVEHIVVFDTVDPMVAQKKNEPYWYKYQKEVFFGKKKIREVNYDRRPKRLGMKTRQFNSLKKRVQRLLQDKAFSWADVENQPGWVEVVARGGSSITYLGEDKQKFLQKVIGVE